MYIDGSSPHSLLCSKHLANDCSVTEGICLRDDVGMPKAKYLKPDVVSTIFVRCVDYIEPSSASNISIHKPTDWPLSEK